MSKVAIEGNALGTGTLTIAAPNTNTNRTLTIPDATTTIVGTDATQTLTNKSIVATQLTGTVAAARLPAGSVLQVIQAVKTDIQSTSSVTYVDVSGMSVTITPTSASSKILVMLRINNMSNGAANGVQFNILRGATTLVSSTAGGSADTNDAWVSGGGGGTTFNDRKISSGALDYLDSPNTTSSTIYKVQFLVDGNTGFINGWATNSDLASVSSITVMEIAA